MNFNMEFDIALENFVDATQTRIKLDYEANYSNVTAPTLTLDKGRKFVKVVSNSHGSRSVFCFVRIEDGAILKAAGWKAPAKHSRGSIYINNGQDAVTVYGAKYL